MDVYHAFEALLEVGNLLLALLLELVLDEESYELVSVVHRHWDLHAAFNQLNFLCRSKMLNVYREGSTHNVFQLGAVVLALFVVKDVLETFGRLGLPLSHIIKIRLEPQQNLVAGRNHRQINKHRIVESDSHKIAHKFKVQIGFECLAVEPVELRVLIELKHRVLRIKQLLHDQLEVFFPNAAHIDTWLLLEGDL